MPHETKPGLLDGFVIVELADHLTEYGGLLLAGLGARVYLVEPPGGLTTRSRRPFANRPGGDLTRRSIPFLARNAGKSSVVLDPNNADHIEVLDRMLHQADGILEGSYSPFRAAAAGRAAATPRATVTDSNRLGRSSIVPFAASGGLSSSGWPHQAPCNAPGWLALDGAGIYAAVMLLVAMRDGKRSGGNWEVPLREAAIAAITPWTRPLHSYGMAVAGQGIGSARLGAGPYPIMRCRDGFIRVLTATPGQWDAWVELLGRPPVLTLPEWESPAFRAANYEVMVAIAEEIVAGRDVQELFSRGQGLGLTITPVLNVDDFVHDSHVRARELFYEVDDPDLGLISLMRPTFRFIDRSSAKPGPAPSLGADAAPVSAVLSSAPEGVSPAPMAPQPGTRRSAPLSGLRVLNCGVGAVVPEAASLLALLGAEVIKLESRTHLDFLRQSGLNGPGDFNSAPAFNQMNLGVLSLSVDMTMPEGRAVAKRLAATCDIVMENLRGPVMGKWGLDYESVRALRPDVIYMSSQGLGDGPYGGYQTYGPNLQTFSAVTGLWAHPDDPYPVGSTLNHPDHIAGKQFLTAVLAALIRRDRTGEGCYLDCAQFEAAAYLLGDKFLQNQLMPASVRALGNASLDMSPHGCYPCAGDDLWCAIAVEDDLQWAGFKRAIAEPWVEREEFSTAEGRLEWREELDHHVARWTSNRTQSEVESVLREAGVPVSRVAQGDDLAADVDLQNQLFWPVPHPTAGTRWQTGVPVAHKDLGRIPVRRSPLLGEHDGHILIDVLGFDPVEVAHLLGSGAIGN